MAKNFPTVPIHDDVKTFDVNYLHGQVDILTGGIPCQPFSVAGKRKGFTDDRYLWPEMFRIIQKCKPNWIILENVPGIIPMLDPILEDLEREAYTWQTYLVPASAIGAPHKRERIWIVAHRNSKRFNIRSDNWEERYIQDNWEQYCEAIQSEWPQFYPKSWATFNAQNWLGLTTDTSSERLQGEGTSGQSLRSKAHRKWEAAHAINDSLDTFFGWQKDQPPIPGVDDGLSNGLDRNKALGNAIVPQIAYIFMQLIKFIEKKAKE